MFGSSQRGVNVYAKISMETGVLAASPNKLIIMLYDGAITACHDAIRFMKNRDIHNKGTMISNAILIIESGLRLSLDKNAGGEIAVSLDALYSYMSYRLSIANSQNQPDQVLEVIKLLTDLKGAWEAIEGMSPDTTNQARVVPNRNIANYARA